MIDFAATFRLDIFALLLLCLSPAAVLGVYKMVDQNTKLVSNPKPGVVYLFEYPRTQIGADQSPLNLKAECWLKLKGIKFHRLSNLLILGSHSKGAAPFAFYQESANHAGSYVDGSDAIITKFAPPIYESRIEDNAMSSLNAHISFNFFALLMVDRRTRDAQGKGGLDWMVAKDDQGRFKDQGLIQQFVPVLVNDRPEDAEKLKPKRTIKINGTQFQIALNPATWTAYFGVYNNCAAKNNECGMEKVQFLTDFLTVNGAKSGHKFETGDWENVNKFMDAVVHTVLSQVLKANGGGQQAPSSEAKLDEMLKLRKIGINGAGLDPEAPFSTLFVDPKSADPFTNPKVMDLLKDWLKEILDRLEDNTFLGGEKPFPADCSLFSMLVQFFETGLNIRELREYFHPAGHRTANVQRLYTYMNKMKTELGLKDKWSELKEYPWPLNYEEPKIGDKFDGPFALKTDSLVKMLARNGSLDHHKLSNYPELKAAAEAVEKKFEKRNHDGKVENAREVKNALRVMAAYLCGLGGGNLANTAADVKDCAATHLASAKFDNPVKTEDSSTEDPNAVFMMKVRQVAYQAVVAYNEGLVRNNILAAWEVARAKNSVNNMFDGNEW